METLAFIHAAISYEDPNPDPELRPLEELDFKGSSSVLLGVLSVGVVTTSLGYADSAQALIRYGDSGRGVARLQRALGVFDDGSFGEETRVAVRRFQSNNLLFADGVAGPATLSALGLPRNLGPGGAGGDRPISDGNNCSCNGSSRPIGTSGFVTARIGLNVRNFPSGSVVYGLPRGASVSLTGARDFAGGRNWIQLSDGNWVAEEFISFG